MKSKITSILVAIIISLSISAQVGIGTNSPNGSAILHLSTTTKGFLPPVMTTANRGNIGTPVEGLLLYNTTDGKLNIYKSGWYSIPFSESGAPGINLGIGAGKYSQQNTGIAIGNNAANTNQGTSSISLGNYAGNSYQNSYAAAIGYNAGSSYQDSYATAIGYNAGASSQAQFSVAIGTATGQYNQGIESIALGKYAGYNTLGSRSIAIGSYAGYSYQYANSIALNATGIQLNPQTSGFFVAPIRAMASSHPTVMYDPILNEILYTSSDARLKSNIQPLTSGLDEVMRLQPVSFNFRESLESSNYDGHNIGFIAQQVKEVIPEAVTENPDSLLAINTTTLIPVLVKAIQELKEENQILSTKIEQLQQINRTQKLFFRKRK
jgi:Chaperone of endosialidase